MRIEFFPAAERELVEAAEDYEAKARGLGSDFILEVERIAGVLVELRSLGEKLDPIHRRLPLRRFPYALIFRRDGDVIRASRSLIGGAGRATGRRVSKIANKLFEPTCETHAAQQCRWAGKT